MKKLPNETYVIAFFTLVAFVAILAMFPYLSFPSFDFTPITGAVTVSGGWSTIVDDEFDFWCDGPGDMQGTPCYGVDPDGKGTGSLAGPWSLVIRESSCEVKNPEVDGCINGGWCSWWLPEGATSGSLDVRVGDEDVKATLVKGSGSFKYQCNPCGHGEWVYYVNPTICKIKLNSITYPSCSALCNENYIGSTGEDRDGYCYCSCPEGYVQGELYEDSDVYQCVVYETRNCNNGIQDYDEDGLDCGGPCDECKPGCDNGMQDDNEDGIDCGGPCEYDCDDICLINDIQDDNEEGVDCGGPCDECIETCDNHVQDEDEDGIDCGGSCPDECSYSVSISPSSAELYANGREEQEFTVTVKMADTGAAIDGVRFSLHAQESRRRIGDPGDLSTYSITTDSNGQATFTYTSPQSNIYDLPFVESEVRLSVSDKKHEGGQVYINLLDPRPKISISKENANVQQEKEYGMAYIDINVDDPDSENGWIYEVKPRSGKVYTTWMVAPDYWFEVDLSESVCKFNWIPPKGPVELRDYMMTLVQGQRSDWNNLKNNMLGQQDDVQDGLELLKDLDEAMNGEDSALGKAAGEVKSYYDFGKNLKGNIDELIKDGNRIKDSITKYEAFLNFLSGGVEVLEITYASKSFVEGKMADPTDSDEFKQWLNGKRDTLLSYGCNSLQTGLRTLADTEREANLESIRVPMHVDVTVTDTDGYKTEEDILLYYTYFYAASD